MQKSWSAMWTRRPWRSCASDLAAAEYRGGGRALRCHLADSLTALADKAEQAFGGIQLVFANAGISAGESGAMWEYSQKDWQWCLNVNLWGVINSINAFMPRLVAADQEAHFVVTGSGNGALLVYPDQPIYTASKAAVHAITENLHYQVTAAQSPVKVSALFPGPHVVDTGLFNSGRVRPQELKKEVEGNASGISSVDDMKKMAAEWGIELQTTHPDEVAQMAVAGLRKNAFWLLETTAETDQKIRDRAQMILDRDDSRGQYGGRLGHRPDRPSTQKE